MAFPIKGVDYPTAWIKFMTEDQIQVCVGKCAAEINKLYKNTPVVLVCLLKGAVWFYVDLTRKLTIPYSTYFVEASSYKDGQTQAESVEILSKINPDKFIGKKIILVDELYDNGTTMELLKTEINKQTGIKYEDIFTLAFFKKNKPMTHKYAGTLDLYSVMLPDLWFVGYGLDDKQEKRGWLDLYAVPKADGVPKTADDMKFFK